MKSIRFIVYAAIFHVCFCTSSPDSSITFDYQGAAAMLEVVQAIHDHANGNKVESLLDRAFELEAYQVCKARYNHPGRAPDNRVPLSQFKRFMLSFLGDSVDTQGNRRIGFLKEAYQDAVEHPEKYARAFEQVKSISDPQIQKMLETALYWLPEGIGIKTNILLLFDIGGGAWVHQMEDGKHYAGFNLLMMLDENGNFDTDNFLGTLAHELHHIGIPVESYFKSISYEELADTSRPKLYTDFVKNMITEGFAQKFCSNAPGKFTKKIYSDKEFAAIERARKNWDYYTSEFEDIHQRAIHDLEMILKGEITDYEKFMTAYTNYWTWHARDIEGKDFVLGRRYCYGSELVGVINEGLGRESLFEIIYDFRKLLPLYNRALINLKPEGHERYLFPEELILKLQQL